MICTFVYQTLFWRPNMNYEYSDGWSVDWSRWRGWRETRGRSRQSCHAPPTKEAQSSYPKAMYKPSPEHSEEIKSSPSLSYPQDIKHSEELPKTTNHAKPFVESQECWSRVKRGCIMLKTYITLGGVCEIYKRKVWGNIRGILQELWTIAQPLLPVINNLAQCMLVQSCWKIYKKEKLSK